MKSIVFKNKIYFLTKRGYRLSSDFYKLQLFDDLVIVIRLLDNKLIDEFDSFFILN